MGRASLWLLLVDLLEDVVGEVHRVADEGGHGLVLCLFDVYDVIQCVSLLLVGVAILLLMSPYVKV